MFKWLPVTLLLLFISVLTAQNIKSYRADKYTVDMYMLNDGSVRIVEEVVFQFTGGPFRFVTRYVPNTKIDKLVFQSAAMDGKEITESSVPNYYALSDRNGLNLKWHYAPLQNETHTFSFQYLVYGMYHSEKGMVRMQWKPLPSEYRYTIDSAFVRLHLPKAIPLSGISFSNSTNAKPTTYGDSLIVYEYNNLSPNTIERIDLSFPEKLIPVDDPKWITHTKKGIGKPDVIGISFVILSILIIFSWVFIGAKMSNQRTRYQGTEIIYDELPSALEPALLGRLANGPYSMAPSVYSTLVSLAGRGVIKIQSLPKEKWYETTGSMSFEFLDNTVELTPTELNIVETIFGKPPRPGAIKLLELQKIIQSNYKFLNTALEDALIKHGFLDPFQMDKRKKLLTIGLIVSLLDFMVIFGALAYYKNLNLYTILGVSSLFLFGNLLLMAGALTRIFTESGILEITSWNAYKKSLRQKMKEPLINGSADSFNNLFPYALVLNLGSEWVTYYKKNGIDIGAVWLENNPNEADSFAPFFLLSTISSSAANGSANSGYGGGGGSSGGGGGGGSSSAG